MSITSFCQRGVALALTLGWLSSAQAIVIGGEVTGGQALNQGGIFAELTLPFAPPNGAANTVGNNTFQTPNLYAFNEGQNLTSTSAIAVNILAGGGSGSIAANTTVSSHYVFFDPKNRTTQLGYVDFDSAIIGVITSTSLLALSDPLVVNNNVTYLNPSARGLESNTDTVFINASNSARLQVDWRASTPGDFVRVLTAFSSGGTDPCSTNPPGVGGCPSASVPEPQSLGLLVLGAMALGLRRRWTAYGRS